MKIHISFINNIMIENIFHQNANTLALGLCVGGRLLPGGGGGSGGADLVSIMPIRVCSKVNEMGSFLASRE